MFKFIIIMAIMLSSFTAVQSKHCIGPSSSCFPHTVDGSATIDDIKQRLRNLPPSGEDWDRNLQRACCMAYDSNCMACSAGMSERVSVGIDKIR